ncbi:PREDICTED: protein MEI2-like 4 [Lupinus angustifolius]|uniref:protein MEI2-like 4 n=1 Tax=Lupinus angustifolius TaxID=3871 RepID=UPI00092EA40A|nr:PREDICTED: protein MEI2-like 4 [Lupinus angustifolius]
MPFQIMDQKGVSASSKFFDDISCHSESNVGLQKQKSIHDQYQQGKNGMVASPGSILIDSASLGINAKSGSRLSQTSLSGETTEKLHFGGEEGNVDVLNDFKESLHYHPISWSGGHMQTAPSSYGSIGNKIATNVVPYESSLFSSSLSEMFSQKLRLMGKDALSDQSISVGSLPQEEPYKSIEEEIIGNLLSDEDDLFSGVIDEYGYSTHARTNDDFEDFDLFSSGGGMELEGDAHLYSGKVTRRWGGDSGLYRGSKGKLPFGEQPCRTLFVRNFNSNVEDNELKALFEQYGDIRTMYTACKHRGFVMISYYDLRAAQNAMQALQNRPLRSRKLDIHYSIPKVNAPEKDIGHGTLMLSGLDSSALNDELRRIFGFYGEIKEIYEYPEMNHLKFIEFYDVRAAEAALHSLNRIGIAGKQIKLEPGHPSLIQQSHKGQDEPSFGQSIIDNLSLTQKVGSGCLENGYNQGFQSAMRQPLNAFVDNAFFRANSSLHNTVGGASAAKVSGIRESSDFADGVKFASNPRFHPHSLPEYHGSLANGSPYSFSSTISNMASNTGIATTEASDRRHIQGMGSTRNVAEVNAGGNGIHAHNGLYHMWNNSSLHQQPSSDVVLWQKTPSLVNGACAPGLPQMPSFARTQPQMLRKPHMDHYGKDGVSLAATLFLIHAPSARPQISILYLSSQLSGSLFAALLPWEQRLQTLRLVFSLPLLSLFYCRYTSKMLLVAIDEQCRGTYDFLYLPIDFRNKCNVGYAFINMIDPAQIVPFCQAFNGKKWEKFNSEKVASLAYARIQGKASLISHFQNSSLMSEDKRCRPILFHTDGPNAGDMKPFPVGANVRVRPGKSRTGSNEENSGQGSSSTVATGEESAKGKDSSFSSD